jgi:hypothetical protein
MPAEPSQPDFIATMLQFLEWYFRTMRPEFTTELMKRTGCATIEEAALRLLKSITDGVRGNRSDSEKLTAADYGAVMDRIAAILLRTRHGPSAVSEVAVPDWQDE